MMSEWALAPVHHDNKAGPKERQMELRTSGSFFEYAPARWATPGFQQVWAELDTAAELARQQPRPHSTPAQSSVRSASRRSLQHTRRAATEVLRPLSVSDVGSAQRASFIAQKMLDNGISEVPVDSAARSMSKTPQYRPTQKNSMRRPRTSQEMYRPQKQPQSYSSLDKQQLDNTPMPKADDRTAEKDPRMLLKGEWREFRRPGMYRRKSLQTPIEELEQFNRFDNDDNEAPSQMEVNFRVAEQMEKVEHEAEQIAEEALKKHQNRIAQSTATATVHVTQDHGTGSLTALCIEGGGF